MMRDLLAEIRLSGSVGLRTRKGAETRLTHAVQCAMNASQDETPSRSLAFVVWDPGTDRWHAVVVLNGKDMFLARSMAEHGVWVTNA
jgi:hypothetical protein